jgi:hypothetical protein
MNPRLQNLRFVAARYIAGSLTPEEAQHFEAEIRAAPGLIGALGLEDHLVRAVNLLDTDVMGRRGPWWRAPAAFFVAAACAVLLAIALGVVLWRWDMAVDRQRLLEAQAAEGFLAPTSDAETVKIDPELLDRYSVGGGGARRIELQVAMRSLKFNQFRVNLARGDGTFVAQMNRMVRDSNGNLRLALNSSMLPPGAYELRIEGITWRGEGVPLKRVLLTLQR